MFNITFTWLFLRSAVCQFFLAFDWTTRQLIAVKCPWRLYKFPVKWGPGKKVVDSFGKLAMKKGSNSRVSKYLPRNCRRPFFFFSCVAQPTKPNPESLRAMMQEWSGKQQDGLACCLRLSCLPPHPIEISLRLSNSERKFAKTHLFISLSVFGLLSGA